MARLNMALAKRRNICKADIKKLHALHEAMNAMAWTHNDFYTDNAISKRERKALAKHVRQLEYMMQDLWRFDRDKAQHVHWKRFYALNTRANRGTTSSVRS